MLSRERKAERPETTNRRCTICGATVAAFSAVMCCHCQTMPWELIEAMPEEACGEPISSDEGWMPAAMEFKRLAAFRDYVSNERAIEAVKAIVAAAPPVAASPTGVGEESTEGS